MSTKNDGGSAFPQVHYWDDGSVTSKGGMSLRDWFAGQALDGILSGPCSRENVPVSEWLDVPEYAYRIADAMLKAREVSP